MQNLRPRTLLLVLISVVPSSWPSPSSSPVLLERAGFGLVIWALLPFAVSMALIGGLGGVLGRAAARGARTGGDPARTMVYSPRPMEEKGRKMDELGAKVDELERIAGTIGDVPDEELADT
jgi:hypothetical protein